MATAQDMTAFVERSAERDLPEMTPAAERLLRDFDLEPLWDLGVGRRAVLATAFCDTAIGMREARLAAIAPHELKGEVGDGRLNQCDVAVAMAAVAARALDFMRRSPPGFAPDEIGAAFSKCDCWPF